MDKIIPRPHPENIEKQFFKPLRQVINAGYFRFKVRGAHHIPSQGQTIFVANHSGWVALDALFLLLAINDAAGPEHLPYLIVHHMLVKIPVTYHFLKNLGLIPADWLHYGKKPLPEAVNPLAIFPEGADGNSKPFWQAYHMKRWKTGFVRVAIQKRAKVVPVAIIGGEEALPVAATLKALKPILGSVAPLPLALTPLPSHWKIYFMEPVDFSVYDPEVSHDQEACQQIADEVYQIVQGRLAQKTYKNPLHWLSALADNRKY